jgi:CheY-like chemotaxis protein
MSALRQVLVVDDDPVVGKSFNRVLSDKGYVVVTAENAAQALEKMREQEYDVVFSDIKMPGMSGIEFAEEVRARKPWTPVVIVTGYGSKDNEARAKAAGVSAFLNKPLSPEMIEASAEHAIHDRVTVTAPAAAAVVEMAPVQASQVAQERGKLASIALFLAAPFIGLAYALMLPAVGMAMLAGIAAKALVKRYPAVKSVGLTIAAPFIGLVYAVTLPFVGTAMLLWVGAKALLGKSQTK